MTNINAEVINVEMLRKVSIDALLRRVELNGWTILDATNIVPYNEVGHRSSTNVERIVHDKTSHS
jgi:hypothetical protein